MGGSGHWVTGVYFGVMRGGGGGDWSRVGEESLCRLGFFYFFIRIPGAIRCFHE